MASALNMFYCPTLTGTLSYKTCILRQKQAAVQEYLECQDCARGKRHKKRFPECTGEAKSVQRWARSAEKQTAATRRASNAKMRLREAMAAV